MTTKKTKPRTMLGASAGSSKKVQAWRLRDLANITSPISATKELDYDVATQLMFRVGARTMREFFYDIRKRPLDLVCEDFSRLDADFLNIMEVYP
jgi:hypothetical protein